LAARIEDYALIGDLHTGALVSREGSIDWLCLPRFDSPACFAALLGSTDNGRWLIQPAGGVRHVQRSYAGDSLILETRFETEDGAVRLVDCMPVLEDGEGLRRIIRLVVGERGRVPMHMELAMRFDYGRTVPWVRRNRAGIRGLSGPNAFNLQTPAPLRGENFRSHSEFSVASGEAVPFVFTWSPSASRTGWQNQEDVAGQAEQLIKQTALWWKDWSDKCECESQWQEPVHRSLITLKALTVSETGGIVAAPTTSLPEWIGGQRNWDYRFCWLRDATFTLYALLISGLRQEAVEWRDWLLRAAAGKPDQLQAIYGPGGERLLNELKVDWLAGYEGSRPVRLGNQAHRQLQLDVYGEILDMFHVARRTGIQETEDAWAFQQAVLDFLESGWRKPDSSLWEVRGPRRHFTHSKVMAWVGLDRATRAVELFGLPGPGDRWRRLRHRIHAEVCSRGFSPARNAFVQYYGSDRLDAALLMLPMVGFLPPDDPRITGTLEAIERELVHDGFVLRYLPSGSVESFECPEGAFLACTFWLADNYAMMGRRAEAEVVFNRLLAIRNDVGLLAEEYDPFSRRQLGNFPQAFSHVCLVNTARNLSLTGPALLRPASDQPA
jgi:GH15 family glucan-1,4-alpha-glucosidase